MNAAKVTLTDAEESRIERCVAAGDGGGAMGAVESIVADRCAAAWDECHESGTPWVNPYRADS